MKIGFIRFDSMQIKDAQAQNGKRTVKWLEAYFRMAGVRPFTAKLSKNKNKETNADAPDYNIYLRGNVNKGDSFRDISIGALWIGTGVFDNVEQTFMTGYVESPVFGRLPISVWRAKPLYENEKLEFLYEISIMKDRQNDQGRETSSNTQANKIPEIDISDDEIPF